MHSFDYCKGMTLVETTVCVVQVIVWIGLAFKDNMQNCDCSVITKGALGTADTLHTESILLTAPLTRLLVHFWYKIHSQLHASVFVEVSVW